MSSEARQPQPLNRPHLGAPQKPPERPAGKPAESNPGSPATGHRRRPAPGPDPAASARIGAARAARAPASGTMAGMLPPPPPPGPPPPPRGGAPQAAPPGDW